MSTTAAAISLGQQRNGQDARIDLAELLATRLLVQGNSGSGKSHLLRRLLEQTARLVQQAIIDPEGDFVTLAEHFGHLVIDAADHTEATLRTAGERMREHRASTVLNLENVEPDQQLRAAGAFLNGMFDAPRDVWYPVLVVVDEAQLFAPVSGGDTSDEARKTSLGAMTNLMCRGRKRGLAGVIATQRLAKLAKNVAAEATNFLMGRTFLDIDMIRAADLLGMERRAAEAFRDLSRGQFIALGPALSRTPLHIAIGTVETASNATGPVLLPLGPAQGQDLRDLILEPAATPAYTSRPRATPAPDLLAQLAAFSPPREDTETAAHTPQTIDPARLDTIIQTLSSEPDADYRPIPTLYQDFLLRARIEGLGRDALDLPQFRARLATIRSGIDPERATGEDWQNAEAIARSLPEDVQPLYLLIARSALDAAPCPTDEALARAYGTHSLGRARRQLAYLEERNVIAVREEGSGKRIVGMVNLGWQTA